MMETCLIIQPGAYGDIFVCAPIAKWYHDRGYKVYWPVRAKFSKLLSYFPYVTPIILPEYVLHEDWLRSDVLKILPFAHEYDLVINLADRGPHPTAQRPGENFEQAKYRIADVPIQQKNKLSWTRYLKPEEELYNKFCKDGEDYILVHNVDSLNTKVTLPFVPNLPIIQVSPVVGYEIPDWYKIIVNAKQIYCIESSVHQFIDGISTLLNNERFLLKRPQVEDGCRFTISTGWNLKYIGENSKIKG